jgi:hypothetical protein
MTAQRSLYVHCKTGQKAGANSGEFARNFENSWGGWLDGLGKPTADISLGVKNARRTAARVTGETAMSQP